MRKIFIDCGAYNGASVRKLKSERKDFDEYEVYCFEPNKHNIKSLNDWLKKEQIKNVSVHDAAVWISNEEKNFFGGTSKEHPTSATLNEIKGARAQRAAEVANPKNTLTKVKCIDITEWIEKNFQKKDYIVLKMDIECAEYEIFEDFFKRGTLSYVNEICGEFHNKKCNVPESKDYEIISKLKKEYNLEWSEWEAIEYY